MSNLAMLRRQALADGGRMEQDEEGALRVIAAERPQHAFGFKVRYVVGLSTPQSTRRAWRENPVCTACGEPVDAPSNAALVILPDKSHRIAHRGECFILAILAANPLIVTGKSFDPNRKREEL